MLNKWTNKYKNLPLRLKATIWFFICSFLQRGISTITTPIFTRLLNTAEYGAYNVFNSWLGIVTVFVTLRIYHGTYTQGLVKFEDRRDEYVSSIQGLNLTMCVVWTGIYLLFRNFWNSLLSLTTIQMLAMFAMIWATGVFYLWLAEQRVDLKYRELMLVTLLASVAKPALGIILVKASTDKVTARILGLAIVEVFGYSWIFFSQLKRGKKFFDAYFWKREVLLNLPMILHFLSQTVLNASDKIMISDMVGHSEAGIYGLAYSISLAMTFFGSAMTHTLTPWIYKKIKMGRQEEISSMAYVSLAIVAVANLMLIVIAPEVVAIFAPPSYREAMWLIPPVALSAYFMYCYDLFAKFELYYEKTNYVMIASVTGAVTNIILNLICIRKFGYMAAAYTTLVCYIIYALMHYAMMRRVCNRFLDGCQVFSPLILWGGSAGFVAVGLLLMLTYFSIIIRYTLVAAAVAVAVIKKDTIRSIAEKLISVKSKEPDDSDYVSRTAEETEA